MKKHALLLAVLAVLLVNNIQAAIWRVNNNPGINANFTSFTAAQNVASNGDTLYFEGSPVSYGDITITKPLVIIGPGYFLTENPQTQANPVSAQFGTVNFNAGSSGSILCGCVFNGHINIKVGNIVIKGNYCFGIDLVNTTSFSNVYILKNYIYDDGITTTSSLAVNNIVIGNNFIKTYYTNENSIAFSNTCNSIINNNVIRTNMHVFNSTISNNIQYSGVQALNNNYYYNNIGSGTQFPSGNGNQQSIDMANVFVGATGNSTDGQWQLKEYSPAIGAGNDGLDCGMFGGTDPYVLSGMPDIPSIYQIIMPSSGNTNTGINVTVKAKTH